VMNRLGELVANRFGLNDKQAVMDKITFLIKSHAIEWLYTERAPCEKGPGMANCAGFLATSFPDLPVFYSFQYPSGGKEELDNLTRIHAALGIFDEQDFMTLREAFLAFGKQDRTEVTEALKAVDKQFNKLDEQSRRAQIGKHIEGALAKSNLIIV
jgi:hypothetical protein